MSHACQPRLHLLSMLCDVTNCTLWANLSWLFLCSFSAKLFQVKPLLTDCSLLKNNCISKKCVECLVTVLSSLVAASAGCSLYLNKLATKTDGVNLTQWNESMEKQRYKCLMQHLNMKRTLMNNLIEAITFKFTRLPFIPHKTIMTVSPHSVTGSTNFLKSHRLVVL